MSGTEFFITLLWLASGVLLVLACLCMIVSGLFLILTP